MILLQEKLPGKQKSIFIKNQEILQLYSKGVLNRFVE